MLRSWKVNALLHLINVTDTNEARDQYRNEKHDEIGLQEHEDLNTFYWTFK